MVTKNIYNKELKKIYGTDPRELPLYGLTDTSRYLKVNIRTLSSWIHGRKYRLDDGSERFWPPVIHLPDSKRPQLSFLNLVEVHVLLGIRRIYNVQFHKVRETLRFLESQFPAQKNPLAREEFWTDKFDLFIKTAGGLICTSLHGQQVIEEAVKQYLHRIDRDVDLSPFRLYPFSSRIMFRMEDSRHGPRDLESQPKSVVIDPLVSFGRPTLVGTGVATNVIAGRFKAGERITTLAADYEIEENQVKEALSYEGVLRRAA
jgi:uncharacterized protein (DUF433 family)